MPEYPTPSQLAPELPSLDDIELVDHGGQKVVYSAYFDGRKVALKLIPLQDKRSPNNEEEEDEEEPDTDTATERAKREFAILEKANTPELAKAGPLGFSTITLGGQNWAYFNEEWIEGRSLDHIIREGPQRPELVAQLAVNLIQAVCWMASQGLIHRDIKPPNIKLANDRSHFVLLDPGIALDLHGPSLTSGAILVGTMGYLSPEQMDLTKKRQLDFRSDLFAAGVVLYEAASGKHPFMSGRTSQTEVLAGIMSHTPPALTLAVPGFPQNLSDLVARFMGKAPHLRFRSCSQALSAAREVADSLGVQL